MAAAVLPLHAVAASPQCDAGPGRFFNTFTGSLDNIVLPVVTGLVEVTNPLALSVVAGNAVGKVAAPADASGVRVSDGAVVDLLTGDRMTLVLPPVRVIDAYAGASLEIATEFAKSPGIGELGPGQVRDLNTGGVITIVGTLPFLCAAR